ncbi:MAG: TonB-dependent receptor plug domain-containing protein [Pyrinomonadaceae bacterium]|nr:TonB-dependent receptor plug domain-containing protein [Pyrinomonadaceae bacterium]
MNRTQRFQSQFTFSKISGNALANLGTAFALLFCLIMVPILAGAQTDTTGRLTGTVLDPSGGAVPGAKVTISSAATGLSRSIMTSDDGNYSFNNLPVGTYRLAVSKDGFKETAVGQVVINVASVTSQNVSLEIGQVSEVVEITADVVQIETQTGTVGEVVSGEQVRELPLNGRSFVQLTQLQPGVSAANNFDSKSKGLFGGVDFSVNGNSGQSNLFLTDGANNNDTGSNRTILLFPSIEAIAEFKSLRNSYGPEYGQAAGAVISIVTRGGSNEFHGSLFYFGRNDALNATEFFANQNGTGKNSLRRSDFGGSIGGPIVKDKAFFFYSQEWNKEIRGQSRFGSVPTPAERGGDFSNPRFAPNGQRCSPDPIQNPNHPGFATQIIPAANLSQAGLTLVNNLFPLPNVANPNSCNNWAQSANSPIDFREENVRIDANINSRNKIFGRYTQDHWANSTPILTGNLWGDDAFPTVESSWTQPSKQAAVKLTTQLGANAINEVQFSYSANRIRVDPGNGGAANAEINAAIPGFFPDADKVNGVNRPHPVFWGGVAPYYSSSGSDLWTQTPFRNSLDIYSIRDDFSMVKGNHTIKIGGLFDKAAKDEDSGPNNESVHFFGPASCCNDQIGNHSGNWGNGMLQDLLTDDTLFGFDETNTQAVGQNRYTNIEFYVGDTWKVRPNLTLELGARYSLLLEPTDARDRISGFSSIAYDPTRPASDPCNGLVVPKGTNPCAGIPGASTPFQFTNRSLRENSYGNLAPRLGVAWDVFSDGKTAIRAGFGQFYLRERTSPYFASLTQNAPFATFIAGQRFLDGSRFEGLSAATNGSPRFGLSPEAATPYSLQFNFSVGRELWRDTALEVGYVGNRARRQLTHNDVNQVLEQNRVAAAFAPDGNAVNALRPFSNYGSIYQFERNGRGDYDSLQVLFRTRFLEKSSLQMAYTFSRSLADYGLNDSSGGTSQFAVLDRNNRGVDFAESDINRPHIFVANMIYNFPSFKSSAPAVRTLIGGWEFATIVRITSGTSLTPNLNATSIQGGGNLAFAGGITGFGSGVQNQRPIRVDGVPCTIEGQKGVFLNPAAWTLVGYRIGQDAPTKSTCSGPPTKNVDMSIYKNFAPSFLTKTFGESARLQFRLEFFNAFNTPQFNGALPTIFFDGEVVCGNAPCSPANNLITSFNPNNLNQPNGNFGIANSTRGGREIQYALKFYF